MYVYAHVCVFVYVCVEGHFVYPFPRTLLPQTPGTSFLDLWSIPRRWTLHWFEYLSLEFRHWKLDPQNLCHLYLKVESWEGGWVLRAPVFMSVLNYLISKTSEVIGFVIKADFLWCLF